MLRGWARAARKNLLERRDTPLLVYWDPGSAVDLGEGFRMFDWRIVVAGDEALVFCRGLVLRTYREVYEFMTMLVLAGEVLARGQTVIDVRATEDYAGAVDCDAQGVHVISEEIRLRSHTDVQKLNRAIVEHWWRVDDLRP